MQIAEWLGIPQPFGFRDLRRPGRGPRELGVVVFAGRGGRDHTHL